MVLEQTPLMFENTDVANRTFLYSIEKSVLWNALLKGKKWLYRVSFKGMTLSILCMFVNYIS